MSDQDQFFVRLSGRCNLSAEVLHLSFEKTTGGCGTVLEPGQYACLSKDLDGEIVKGYYSLASEPCSDKFELCVRVRETGGEFGQFFTQCRLGEIFTFELPVGNFRLRAPLRSSVFAVHGTGIAPVRSMLRYLLKNGVQSTDVPLTLLQGARTEEDLYYSVEFEEFVQHHSIFRYWPIVSGESPSWTGRTGRVQEHLHEALGSKLDDTDVYLCGSNDMVKTTVGRLQTWKFDERAIVYEKYAQENRGD